MATNGVSKEPARIPSRTPAQPGNGARKLNTSIPHILPHEKVFPIQIGSELFRLSGASISSDAPSYFSQFFQVQLQQAAENNNENGEIRTLYIDRDPATFADISLHLQGYHVEPRDGSHFVKLFADAQFYSLPRLISQLYEETIFIKIGQRDFKIVREVFSGPGNSPNYFTLGFAVFFSTPSEVFPGLNREGLLRPPSIMPPNVPNRSSDIFAELLHYLDGYPVKIRDEGHRADLLRDCRYFHFRGLEQKLIRHQISYNLARKRSQIIIRLEDVRQSGISIVADPSTGDKLGLSGWVTYARPFEDEKPHELVLEIGAECTKIDVVGEKAEFFGDGKARVSKLFDVIATKLKVPAPLDSPQPASPGHTLHNDGLFKVVVDRNSYVILDGQRYRSALGRDENSEDTFSRKRQRHEISGEGDEWIVRNGLWRLHVRNAPHSRGGVECVLVAVKLDAFSGELGRNTHEGFLAN